MAFSKAGILDDVRDFVCLIGHSQLFHGRKIGAIRVSADSYFVSTVYNVQVHGNIMMDAGIVERACVVRSSDIEAVAIMRWFPLARRGFLRAGE